MAQPSSAAQQPVAQLAQWHEWDSDDDNMEASSGTQLVASLGSSIRAAFQARAERLGGLKTSQPAHVFQEKMTANGECLIFVPCYIRHTVGTWS